MPVRRGYVVYTRSRNKVVEVTYEPEDFRRIGGSVREIAGGDPPGEAAATGTGEPLCGLLLPIYLRLSGAALQSGTSAGIYVRPGHARGDRMGRIEAVRSAPATAVRPRAIMDAIACFLQT